MIHRHGMDERTAFEVEAALIDAYPGFTNIAGGAGSNDYGAMHAREIVSRYSAEPGAFIARRWLEATAENFPGRDPVPGRFGFEGEVAPDDIKKLYVRKRVPDEYRKYGAANPITVTRLRRARPRSRPRQSPRRAAR